MIAVAFFLGIGLVGCVAGYLLLLRGGRLAYLPGPLVGTLYWVAVGWFGDDYDIGREGLVLVTGLLGGAVAAAWIAGVAAGRRLRADVLRRALRGSRRAPGTDPGPASRR